MTTSPEQQSAFHGAVAAVGTKNGRRARVFHGSRQGPVLPLPASAAGQGVHPGRPPWPDRAIYGGGIESTPLIRQANHPGPREGNTPKVPRKKASAGRVWLAQGRMKKPRWRRPPGRPSEKSYGW